jgi:hypothetical protein
MPTHYVYQEPDKNCLYQGDILCRSPELDKILGEFHPYYKSKADYRYFMVITQTCDLVRRQGSNCGAHHVELCAVRPVEAVIENEAARHQEWWQQPTHILSTSAYDHLKLFLESLLDNNQKNYFYLHEDQSLGISGKYCAYLTLSIAISHQHYDGCLASKIAQLKEPFQAKLGWLIGHIYNRVGTTEWNEANPEQGVGKTAGAMIKSQLEIIPDRKITEALAELRKTGTPLDKRSPDEISKVVQSHKIVAKSQQFKIFASNAMPPSILDWISTTLIQALKADLELKEDLRQLFAAAGSSTPEVGADQTFEKVKQKIKFFLRRENYSNYQGFIEKLVSALINDPVLKSLIEKSDKP